MHLATRDLVVVRGKPDWRTQLLAVIANPTVAYGLMLIGIWGLLLEGYNPGAVLPGVVGSICLLVALFAFQILSVNYAGLALVAVGTGMIIAEFFFPAYGSLGIGGLIAFVVGSLILFDTDVPGMNVGAAVDRRHRHGGRPHDRGHRLHGEPLAAASGGDRDTGHDRRQRRGG